VFSGEWKGFDLAFWNRCGEQIEGLFLLEHDHVRIKLEVNGNVTVSEDLGNINHVLTKFQCEGGKV
jgi:hypothetical protein